MHSLNSPEVMSPSPPAQPRGSSSSSTGGGSRKKAYSPAAGVVRVRNPVAADIGGSGVASERGNTAKLMAHDGYSPTRSKPPRKKYNIVVHVGTGEQEEQEQEQEHEWGVSLPRHSGGKTRPEHDDADIKRPKDAENSMTYGSKMAHSARNNANSPINNYESSELCFPQSSIPIDLGVLEQFTAPPPTTRQYVYHEVSGRLEQVVFPAVEPNTRADSMQLDRWMHKYMRLDGATLGQLKGVLAGADCGEAAEVARRNLHVLDMAHAELVRQVAHHCHERGVLMMQMWQASRDLYESILREQQSVMVGLHRRVLDAAHHTQQVQAQMEEVQRAHAAQVLGLASTSRARERAVDEDAELIRGLRQKVFSLEKEMRLMQESIADACIWFPGFLEYRKCDLRDELPSVGENGKEEEEEEGEAEEANGRHGVEEEEVGGKGKEDPIGHRRLPELSKYLGDADRLVLRDIQRVYDVLVRRAADAAALDVAAEDAPPDVGSTATAAASDADAASIRAGAPNSTTNDVLPCGTTVAYNSNSNAPPESPLPPPASTAGTRNETLASNSFDRL